MATRWRSITCGCVLTYEGLEPPNGDVAIKPIVEVDCGAHGKGLTAQQVYAAVLASSRAITAALKK